MKKEEKELFDTVVLGGGAGGVPAAIRVAQLGGKVAIIERRDFGGQCMNRGCIPFGHMMLASNILGFLTFGKEMGLTCHEITKDYHALLKRQDELISFMRQGVRSTLKKNGVEIIEGEGSITEKGKLNVNGKLLSYKNIILATGSTWLKPEFPGAELDEVVNSDSLLTADSLPKIALVFGGSPWLIEIAQFLHRFDTQTMIATPDDSILSGESKTITTRLRKVLRDKGIEVKTQSEIVGISKKKNGVHVELNSKGSHETVEVDKVIALERSTSLKGLGLRCINLDEDSPYLKVSDRMETEVEGIYAVGDLTGPPSRHYSHLASQMGIVAAQNSMGKEATFNARALTRVIFTQPEVACVGFTPKVAKSEGYEVIVGAAPLSMNPYGMILGESEGIVEVVADKRYGEILGVHIIGTAASEMAGQAVIALQMEMTLEDLANTPFPHPTLSESLAEAARDALGNPIYLP